MKAYDLIVRGRVQRVGYRRHIQGIAQDLGLSGYVENNMDGTVHIFIQGHEDKLIKFIDKARKPEYPAKVIDIEVREAEPNPDYKYFVIRFGSMGEELQEGFGAMQSIFIEYWREFRDYRQEFRDYRNEFKDYRQEFREFAERTDKNFQILMEKYGEISAKLTEIMNMLLEESRKSREMLMEIRRESSETREMLNESIKLLRKAVEKLGKS